MPLSFVPSLSVGGLWFGVLEAVGLLTEVGGGSCCWRLLLASIVCAGDGMRLDGGPPGRVGGGKNAGLRGSSLDCFFPSVETLDVAFFVHGVGVVREMRQLAERGPLRFGTLVEGEVGRVAAVLVFDSFGIRRR